MKRVQSSRSNRRAPRQSRLAREVLPDHIQLCQYLGPAAPHAIWGVDSLSVNCGEPTWEHRGCIDWQAFAQGEYVGHFRTPHVPEYRFRVDDRLEFRYRRTRTQANEPYRLQVGDVISVISLTDQRLADAQPQDTGDPTVSSQSINQPQSVVQTGRLDHLAAHPLISGCRANDR